MQINSDCKHFKGYIPCKPHKEIGVHCRECDYYIKQSGVILIIKLGAIGDVIRTSALVHKIKAEHPNSAIWWLTYSPDVVPSVVDNVLPFNLESILLLQHTFFLKIINLDKDTQACALVNSLSGEKKYGFGLVQGKPAPLNSLAEHKFGTGLFDDVNQKNKKNYLEEIFEICNWKYSGEEYILDCDECYSWDIIHDGKVIVGLNTGCGDRWVSRLWKNEYWIKLINLLTEHNYYPILLGGKQEHDNNTELAKATGAEYLGHFPLKQFISLVNQCDVVVSAVSMSMHIAIGLKKHLILFNNIFNPFEFELFGRGKIIQPQKECTCFFSQKCKNPDYFCMDSLFPETVFEAIEDYKINIL